MYPLVVKEAMLLNLLLARTSDTKVIFGYGRSWNFENKTVKAT